MQDNQEKKTVYSIFRPFSDSSRSDRSAGDRGRHKQKIRQSIKENLHDLIAEESIIGKDRDKVIKVPIRGVKEYRFVYGDNTPGVGQGDGNSQQGQVVGKGDPQQGQGQGQDKAGDQAGQDIYETDVTLGELVEMLFENLQLPDLERKAFRQIMSDRTAKHKGYRHEGIRVRLDPKRTAKERIKRRKAAEGAAAEAGEEWDEDERFPFKKRDMRYKHMENDPKPESNAVVVCIMDTSGSMDTQKKFLARSFFFLLSAFVASKYQNTEIVFVSHTTEGKEVTEDEFFHKGESGGTFISSGYNKALEIINDRYHPSLWNVYAFHCSDGDNFESDNAATLKAAKELCDVCRLFGYGEIKPLGSRYYESSMLNFFRKLDADNFQTVLIERPEDVYTQFKALMKKEATNKAMKEQSPSPSP